LPHSALVLAAAENDATDMIAATGARRRYDAFAILAPIQAFNLLQIWFDAGVLKFVDSLDYQARAAACDRRSRYRRLVPRVPFSCWD
jgi:hypothetical protein